MRRTGKDPLHATVAPIAHPAIEAKVGGHAFRPIAKADTLHAAFEADTDRAPVARLLLHASPFALVPERHTILARVGGADQHALLKVAGNHLRPTPWQLAPLDLVAERLQSGRNGRRHGLFDEEGVTLEEYARG